MRRFALLLYPKLVEIRDGGRDRGAFHAAEILFYIGKPVPGGVDRVAGSPFNTLNSQ